MCNTHFKKHLNVTAFESCQFLVVQRVSALYGLLKHLLLNNLEIIIIKGLKCCFFKQITNALAFRKPGKQNYVLWGDNKGPMLNAVLYTAPKNKGLEI